MLNWKGFEEIWSWPILMAKYPNICLEGLRKTAETLARGVGLWTEN
jgi:hypothetical protein